MSHSEQDVCRICSSSLKTVLSLGDIYPSNFVDETEGNPVPLVLKQCDTCGLVQLGHTVNLDDMYRQYYYQSGINPSMVGSLQHVVNDIESTIELKPNDVIIDIGCNDGTMFDLFRTKGLYKVGFEPALNLKEKASKKCNLLISDYFAVEKLTPYLSKAKVITAIAMFYDLPNPNIFVQDVTKVLEDDGIFVIQFTDLISMLKINAFDNICHEHLEYYKLSDVVNLLDKFGLKVFKVSYNKVNGGSIRVFAGRNYPVQNSVLEALTEERAYLDSFTDPMKSFAGRVNSIKKIVLDFLVRAQQSGINIYGMGASTKGNTLLQYFGISKNLIPCIAEVNTLKFGKKTIASNIPIISEEEAFSKYPDMFFILPWHFVDDFISRNLKYLEDGGAFIVPLPEPKIYYMQNGKVAWTLLEKVLG